MSRYARMTRPGPTCPPCKRARTDSEQLDYISFYQAIIANDNVRSATAVDITGLNAAAAVVEGFGEDSTYNRIRSTLGHISVVHSDDGFLSGLYDSDVGVDVTHVKTRPDMVKAMEAACLFKGGTVRRQKRSDSSNAVVKGITIDPDDPIKTACRLVHAISTITSAPVVSAVVLAVFVDRLPYLFQQQTLALAFKFDTPIRAFPYDFFATEGTSIVYAPSGLFRGAAYVNIFLEDDVPSTAARALTGLHRVVNNGIDVGTVATATGCIEDVLADHGAVRVWVRHMIHMDMPVAKATDEVFDMDDAWYPPPLSP